MSYRILSQDCLADNNSHATGLNNNDLIVGPSGAGKTRGYVLPNILQCSESFIVADTKNSLRAETEAVLRQNGYKVLSLDLCGGPSSGYNPLDYIRLDPKTNRHNEQDIMAVSTALIPIETPRDPFWEFSARIYLESIIGYVLESLPEEEHTMDSVVRLSREIGTGRLSKLMDELAVLDPDSFAARRYSICRDGEKADRTNACVLMFLAEKLAPLDYAGARAMFHNPDKIGLARLGREKTAVFLGVSDTDRSMDRLANLFYTQALHVLCDEADRNPAHRLNVPVRFILDDFSTNTVIPNFRQRDFAEHFPAGEYVRPRGGYDHHQQLRPLPVPGRAGRGDRPVHGPQGQPQHRHDAVYAPGQCVAVRPGRAAEAHQEIRPIQPPALPRAARGWGPLHRI